MQSNDEPGHSLAKLKDDFEQFKKDVAESERLRDDGAKRFDRFVTNVGRSGILVATASLVCLGYVMGDVTDQLNLPAHKFSGILTFLSAAFVLSLFGTIFVYLSDIPPRRSVCMKLLCGIGTLLLFVACLLLILPFAIFISGM